MMLAKAKPTGQVSRWMAINMYLKKMGLKTQSPGHKAKPTGREGWVEGQVHVLHEHEAHLWRGPPRGTKSLKQMSSKR